MRKILSCVVLFVIALNATGQTPRFKPTAKKTSGTIDPAFRYETIDGRNSLKSASAQRARSHKSIDFRASVFDPIVIRKGNSPVFIEQKVNPLKSASSVTSEGRFFSFMEENRQVTNIDNPRETFRITGIHKDDLGMTHIRTIQQYKGVEVYGTESVFHISNETERFTGSLFRTAKEIEVIPEILCSQALEAVKKDLVQHTVYRDLTLKEKNFLKYDGPECSLVLFGKPDNNYKLAWMVSVRPNFIEEWNYMIDAVNGSIIRKYNNTKSDGPETGTGLDLNNISQTFDVYLEAGTYYLINIAEPMYNAATEEGMIMTMDANNTSTSDLDYSLITSTNNSWTGKTSAVSAHYNAFLAYEYFRTKFNRNSLNGLGGNIISFVNVAEDDGTSMQNAFWNGQAIFYGNGGSHFKSLSGGLDVSAHELGHGVVSNSANLEYLGQSGAINESYADIFGSMVDRDDWLIGEDVVKTTHYPSGALRNMSDPHNGGTESDIYWQPAHLSEMYLGSQDNGGVHINSGICNRAYYLFATEVTKEKAELIFYRALTEYLTKTSQFIDLRIAVVQATKDLYGASSAEAAEAAQAFDAVGIYPDKPEAEEPDEYDPNPGTGYLLIYNTDENFAPTLYTSPASGDTYQPLSNTVMKGKVSVTDDGSAAVFVGSDDRIHVMTLDPENWFEEPISNEQFFDNVAVSKDGNRIAAISIEEDASIFVYDFEFEEWKQFILYNPTTSDENLNSGGVLFADAIEFDHTGEYLMYDAYNELNSSTSQSISYWDVGFIKVWDNETQSFGDGTILKLFTQLPENVSIGNPVFSKNSPDIIAFDYYYYDGIDEEFAIYGANLETGDINMITDNTTLGYPSFSKEDDQLAFTVAVSQDEEDVYTIGLGDDKITPAGEPAFKLEYAKWPVYYAIGERELGLAPVANFTADYKSGSAPLHVKYVDLSTNDPTQWEWTFQGGTPSSSTQQNPEVNYNSPGTYKVTLKASNSTGNNTLNREAYIVVSGFTPAVRNETKALFFYPNPADNILNISYDGKISVRIFSLSGVLMCSEENRLQIDISQLSQGVYILEIETASGTSKHKLLKR